MLVNARYQLNKHIVEIQITLSPLLDIKVRVRCHFIQTNGSDIGHSHGKLVGVLANRCANFFL